MTPETACPPPATGWATAPRLLSPEARTAIHQASLVVLERTGVHLPLSDARLDVLTDAGCRVDHARRRVFFPPEVVQTALERAPAAYPLCARDPARDLPLGAGCSHLSLDGTGLRIIDPATGRIRASTYADLCDAVRVADALPQIGFLWPCISAQDRPSRVQPIWELLAMLTHSSKHAQAMTVVDPFCARAAVEMARTVAGGAQALRQRPLISSFQCSISPLSYDADGLEAALVFAEAGIPAGFMIMPIAASTAPASLAGAVAQGNAELLAGITFLQVQRPGAPTFYGSCATMLELRRGGVTAGGPEDVLLQAAYAEMARFYDLPSNIGTFATGAKASDWQAAVENTLSGMVSLFCGADMLCGAGLTRGATVFSFEQLLLDCEIYDLLQATRRGVPVSPEQLALEVIDAVGPQGHYLLSDHTLAHSRSVWQPSLLERRSDDEWVAAGSPSPADAARRRAMEWHAAHRPAALACSDELQRLVEAYQREAEDGGGCWLGA